MTDETDTKSNLSGDGENEQELSRREAVKALGKYGALIAGATTMVLSSRQVLAGPDTSQGDKCLRKNPPPYCP